MPVVEFDTQNIVVDERPVYGPLEPGKYEMMVVRSDVKSTKRGDGHYIELEMMVVDGPKQNRRHWEIYNWKNPSEKAMTIARQSLARLCQAINRPDLAEAVLTGGTFDTQELHDRPFVAILKPDPREPSHVRVSSFIVSDSAPEPRPAAKPAPKAATGGRPW